MLQVAALSDVGCRRTNNEDSFGYDTEAGIFAVSDGMGGSAAGEVASHIAIESTLAHYRHTLTDGAYRSTPMQHRLYYATAHANASVYQQAVSNPKYTSMGATLVVLCIASGTAVIANIGDSRAYLLRDGTASVITVDHSLGAESERSGHPLPPNHPSFNVITRAVGIGPDVQPDLFGAQLQSGDRVLLASDGLMKHLSDADIARIVHAAPTVSLACEQLIEAVKAFGASDNVTCLLVEA